jgi:hypothetical protein
MLRIAHNWPPFRRPVKCLGSSVAMFTNS